MKKIYTQESLKLLQELTEKRNGINVTVGMLKQGRMVFDAWNSNFESIAHTLAYDIGSITKLFTASLLAKNISEKKICMNTGLNEYIDDLPERFYPSIKQLATHSSGYPTEIPFTKFQMLKLMTTMNKKDGFLHTNPYHGTLNEAKMLEILRDETVPAKEHKFAYNNFAFGVLGYILGQKTNQTAYEAIDDFAKNELNLTETNSGIAVEMLGFDRKQQPVKSWEWDKNDIISAAGSLVSTAGDLLRFGHAHLVNSPSYLSLCHNKYTNGNKEWDMGLGWRIDKNQKNIHWHDGNAGGFSCILILDMESNLAITVLTNYGLLHLDELGRSLLKDCRQLTLDENESYSV